MIRAMNRLVVLATLLLAPCAWADPPTTISSEDQKQVAHALQRGKEIYLHDQAAWHVTDAMRRDNPDSKIAPVIGWVTKRLDDKRVVAYFVRRDGDKLRLFYSGETEGSTLVAARNYADDRDAPELDADLMLSMRAVAAARSAVNGQVCGRPPNFVTLPSESAPGGWDVYAIVPEVSSNEAALAGHKRITLGADGKIADVHAYSNSCLINRVTPDAVAMMVSLPADLGVTPNEMHVFQSLTHKLALLVAPADGRIWAVEQTRIRLMDLSKAPPQPKAQ